MVGRRPHRDCLPSKEREQFVAYERSRGCAFITERQKNRYVDEFLRFCKKDAKRITAADLRRYAKHLEGLQQAFETARAKMMVPLQWCRWMAATEKIAKDPSLGMDAGTMVSGTKKRMRTPDMPDRRFRRRWFV
jgi:hypothetical protein